MSKAFQSNSRQAILNILKNFKPAERNAAELINKFSADANRAMVVEITYGVIRNYDFINNLIAKSSQQSLKNIPEKILNCLRLAAYELVFTNQPQYTVVNEAVELAKENGSRKAGGFANAVLRKITASIINKSADLKNSDPKKTLPISPGIGCEFNFDVLPDEKNKKAEYLSCAFSLPLWLIEQWLVQFDYQQTKNICFASNRRASIYARPNRLKITAQELVEILKNQKIDCELVEQYKPVVSLSNPMVKLNKPGNIAQLESFKAGLFAIQDIASSSVVPLLNPKPGWKIYDICAAPGTKTTQLAELINDNGLIIATDKDDLRLNKINENVQRLGITSVKVLTYDDFLKGAKPGSADAVLLDVPCSNTGVLSKRAEVRFRLGKNQIDEISQIQRQLLEFASTLVTKGGKICYSTCSILNQENKEVVNNFIKHYPDFSLEKEQLILPSAGTYDYDGGYAAIILKK